MELFAILALMLLFMGAFLYLLVCVDPNSQSLFGKLNRFVFNTIPIYLRKLFGNKIIDSLSSIVDYVFNQNHPLVQYFYLLVAVGGYIVYAIYGFMRTFINNPQVSYVDSLIGSGIAFYSFYSYYQACHYSPGIINANNANQYVEEFKEYYDEIIYYPNNKCQTCNFVKPARSKHCRICNVCVSRFDHHCVWIRQCVGQKNYKYFLKFIGIHSVLCNWGGIYGLKALYGLSVQKNLINLKFKNSATNEIYNATYVTVIQYLFYTETMFFFITILCWVMGITLTLFFIYHLFMLKQNITTNERVKKSDFKEYFENQIEKMKASLKSQTNEETRKQLENKIVKFEKNIKKLSVEENIGVINGWKQIFRQPNEVKWIAERNLKKSRQNESKTKKE